MPRRAEPRALISTFAACLGALLLIAALAEVARAENTSALIAAALDQPFEMNVKDLTPLPDIMKKIEDKTGVPIKADPSVWDLLPWGEQTTLTVTIKGQTLRHGLTSLTRSLGLTYRLGDEAIVLEPMPALRRLGRRATLQEIQCLEALASNRLPELKEQASVSQMLDAVDNRLKATPPFAVEDRAADATRAQLLRFPRNATLLDALELMAQETPATWYPWGKYIVVIPKRTLVIDHLTKTFTVRYANTDVAQVLEDLSKTSGVHFTIEPGALQKVPAEFRSIRVYWENVSVEQALETLKGLTGLQYAVTDDGLTISNALPAAPAGGGSGDPAVALVTLDNGVQVMLRRSDVPPDVQAYLKHRADGEVQKLRLLMKAEGFKPDPGELPTTLPSTRPAPR